MSKSQKYSTTWSKFETEIENQLDYLNQDATTIEDKKISSRVQEKLKIVFDEIEFLKHQTIDILRSGITQNDLTKAECRVAKVQGKVYHYYEKRDGKKFITILSPNEWGKSCQFKYLGSFIFGYDNMWEPCKPEKNEQSSDLEESLRKIKELL